MRRSSLSLGLASELMEALVSSFVMDVAEREEFEVDPQLKFVFLGFETQPTRLLTNKSALPVLVRL